jgi:hypothetical protein
VVCGTNQAIWCARYQTFIFSCFNQDQKLDEVDFVNLRARLRQNTVVEKLTNLWLTRLLSREQVALS